MFEGLKSCLGHSRNGPGFITIQDQDIPTPRTIFGREFSAESCLTITMVVFAVAGAILALLGIAIYASCTPQTAKIAFFQQLHKFSWDIAKEFGSNIETLYLFSMTVGGSFFVGGIGCLIQQRARLLDVPIVE